MTFPTPGFFDAGELKKDKPKQPQPKDWEDLGPVNTDEEGKMKVHSFCHTRVNVGKKDGQIFYWCPKCKIKLN